MMAPPIVVKGEPLAQGLENSKVYLLNHRNQRIMTRKLNILTQTRQQSKSIVTNLGTFEHSDFVT